MTGEEYNEVLAVSLKVARAHGRRRMWMGAWVGFASGCALGIVGTLVVTALLR